VLISQGETNYYSPLPSGEGNIVCPRPKPTPVQYSHWMKGLGMRLR